MLSPVETGDNSCTQRVKTLSCAIGTTTTINAVIPGAGRPVSQFIGRS